MHSSEGRLQRKLTFFPVTKGLALVFLFYHVDNVETNLRVWNSILWLVYCLSISKLSMQWWCCTEKNCCGNLTEESWNIIISQFHLFAYTTSLTITFTVANLSGVRENVTLLKQIHYNFGVILVSNIAKISL